MRPKVLVSIFLPALIAAAIDAKAQDNYPSRPIEMVTTFAAGMTTDVVARIVAEKLTQRLGQPVTVQNKPGAGGTIATQSVAIAPPDGYTLLMLNSAHSVNPFLYQSLQYDTIRDFAGVALVAETPIVIFASPSLGVRNLKELIALAKQKPGSINYPSSGIGSTSHLAGAAFATLVGIDMVHVPYKTQSAQTADFLAGRVQVAFVPPTAYLSQAIQGKFLTLGVATVEPMREPFVVPSVKEMTNLDYIFVNWYGLLAPAKTPSPILERLSRTVVQILEEEDVKEKYKALLLTPRRVVVLREFDALIRADRDRMGPVVKASGARAN
ncbi:MAG: tripartite tricarboxylate transporter substrate binding protein [Betaproteobacteria bacterium]|nr:tripartite tricarboxylate transporter substrate binding protein [Betaproteobacteria bacterium]